MTFPERVLERMGAFIDEKDDRSRMPSYGKLGLVAVVEDGAHHCIVPAPCGRRWAEAARP